MIAIEDYYTQKQRDFWTMYTPVFNNADYLNSISEFMQSKNEPDALLRSELVEFFSLITAQDDDIRWIVIYRGGDGSGYLFDPESKSLTRIPSEFWNMEHLADKTKVRMLFSSANITLGETTVRTYAIAGDTGSDEPGSMMVGYETLSLQSIYNRYDFDLPPRILLTTLDGGGYL